MVRVARMLVIVLLLYFALTEGVPWVRKYVGDITKDSLTGRELPDNDGPRLCVFLAEDASEAIGVQIRHITPSATAPEVWDETSLTLNGFIRDAESSCSCADPACGAARRALSEMEALVSTFDGLVRGKQTGTMNLARHQENIQLALGQARGLVDQSRQGEGGH